MFSRVMAAFSWCHAILHDLSGKKHLGSWTSKGSFEVHMLDFNHFWTSFHIFSILHTIWLVNKCRAESIQWKLPLVPDVVHHRVPGLSHAERALTVLNRAARSALCLQRFEHSFLLSLQIVKLICLKVDPCGLSLLRRCCRASNSLILELQCVNSICFSTQRVEMM